MKRLIFAVCLCLALDVSSDARMNMVVVGQGATATCASVYDTFATDTSANYYKIRDSSAGVVVSAGKAVPETPGHDTWTYNTSSVGGADQYVQADLTLPNPATDNPGIIVRCNGDTTSATGYIFEVFETYIHILYFSGGTRTETSPASIANTWAAGATHKLKVHATGTTFTVYVDGSSIGSITDSSYSTGNYAGIGWRLNGSASPQIDNFSASTDEGCLQ